MNDKLPEWIPRVIVTAVITLLITGALSWASSTSELDSAQSTAIAVLKQQTVSFDKSLDEMKSSQRRIEDKLDVALRPIRTTSPVRESRPRPSSEVRYRDGLPVVENP